MTRVAPFLPLLLLISISTVLARFQDGLIRKLQYSIALQEDELPGISSPVSHEASVHTRRALRRFSKSEVDRESRSLRVLCLPS
jgi:hypothetical protein